MSITFENQVKKVNSHEIKSVTGAMRIITLFCFFIHLTFLTPAANEGNSIIRNFTPSEYQGGSRIYSVICTNNGLLYAGDKNGILEFDGENWQKIETGFPVTSMCTDRENTIYVAGKNGIGKLQNDSTNTLRFISLNYYLTEVSDEKLRLSEVFNINEKILFVLGNEILISTPKRLRIIESPHHFQYYQKLNNELFLYSPADGIFRIRDSKLELVSNNKEILHKEVRGFFTNEGKKYLIANNSGIYQFDEVEAGLIGNEISTFIKQTECRGINQVDDSTFVLKTYYNGLYLFQNNGDNIKRYNYDVGLINNTVFCVFKDSWRNLWVATAAGISAIPLNFQLTIYDSKQGIGTGYSAQVLNNKVYLGTSQGLYRVDADSEQNNKFVKLFGGHIFGLHKIGDRLYFGHALGIYTLQDNTIEQVSNVPGGWDLKRIPWLQNKYLTTTVAGLLILEQSNKGKLAPVNVLPDTEWVRQCFEFDSLKYVWAESKYGVSRFSLSEKLDDVEHLENFDRIESGNQINKVRKLFNELYFIADSGIYNYNYKKGSFSNSSFTPHLKDLNCTPTNLMVDKGEKVWLFTNKKLLFFRKNNGALTRSYSGILEYANGLYPTNYENICELDSNYVLIGQEQGFLCYNKNVLRLGLYSAVYIRKIQLSSKNGEIQKVWGNESIVNQTQTIEMPNEIAYENNSVKFYFSAGCSNYNEIKYQTYLIGYDENWTEWNNENIREFTNLPAGSYKFVIRSINQSDEYSYISNCKFTIRAPWYLSQLAFFTYFILLLLFVFLVERIIRFRIVRIQKKVQKNKEDLKFRKEQEQIQDKLKTEKEIIRFKHEKLKIDVLYKSRELADSTMSIIEKNRFLTELKTELEGIKQLSEKNKLVTDDVGKVIRKINRGIDNEENWNAFEDYFDDVHENFFKKMKKKYPILTAKDLRLCAYLKMHLSTKEISPLLNITVRGVEISRYRLRKKLGLGRDDNLIDFLLKI